MTPRPTAPSELTELLPCKFCTSKVVFVTRPDKPKIYTECTTCGAWWPWEADLAPRPAPVSPEGARSERLLALHKRVYVEKTDYEWGVKNGMRGSSTYEQDMQRFDDMLYCIENTRALLTDAAQQGDKK